MFSLPAVCCISSWHTWNSYKNKNIDTIEIKFLDIFRNDNIDIFDKILRNNSNDVIHHNEMVDKEQSKLW